MDTPFLTREVTVEHQNGLHMIPLTKFIRLAESFRCELSLSRVGGEPADARSMLELLGLGAEKGTKLTLLARGEGAEDALQTLVDWFAHPDQLMD